MKAVVLRPSGLTYGAPIGLTYGAPIGADVWRPCGARVLVVMCCLI